MILCLALLALASSSLVTADYVAVHMKAEGTPPRWYKQYHVSEANMKITFQEAQTKCREDFLYGRLFSPFSGGERQISTSIAKSASFKTVIPGTAYQGFWINIDDIAEEGIFRTDGDSPRNLVFDVNVLQTNDNNTNCIAQSQTNHRHHIIPCDTLMPFICEVNLIRDPNPGFLECGMEYCMAHSPTTVDKETFEECAKECALCYADDFCVNLWYDAITRKCKIYQPKATSGSMTMMDLSDSNVTCCTTLVPALCVAGTNCYPY